MQILHRWLSTILNAPDVGTIGTGNVTMSTMSPWIQINHYKCLPGGFCKFAGGAAPQTRRSQTTWTKCFPESCYTNFQAAANCILQHKTFQVLQMEAGGEMETGLRARAAVITSTFMTRDSEVVHVFHSVPETYTLNKNTWPRCKGKVRCFSRSPLL